MLSLDVFYTYCKYLIHQKSASYSILRPYLLLFADVKSLFYKLVRFNFGRLHMIAERNLNQSTLQILKGTISSPVPHYFENIARQGTIAPFPPLSAPLKAMLLVNDMATLAVIPFWFRLTKIVLKIWARLKDDDMKYRRSITVNAFFAENLLVYQCKFFCFFAEIKQNFCFTTN